MTSFRWSILLLAAIAAFATLNVPLNHALFDPFHEGEYLSAWVHAVATEHGSLPRLIHGGMDHIPARLAAVACDPDRQVACVRRFNGLATFAASLLFLLTARLLVQPLATGARAMAMLPAISLVLFVNGGATHAVDLQQGSPAVRDLGVVTMLLPLVAWSRRQENGGRGGGEWLLAVAGLVAGLGWFWAYNRGTVGLLMLGCAALGALVLLRNWRAPLMAAAGLALGLVLSEMSGLYGTAADNIDNIAYWLHYRNLYGVPMDAAAALAVGPAVLLLGAALTAAFLLAWTSWRSGRRSEVLLLTLLVVLTVLYVLQTVARPDRPHVAWALWPLMLLVTALMTQGLLAEVRARRIMAAIAAAFASIVALHYGPTGLAGPIRAPERLLARMSSDGPAPRDVDLADAGLRAAAAAIRATAPECTFAMTNEGMLYLLAAVPPCSRFAFPIHVGHDHEAQVIAELSHRQPPAILFDSPFWSARIDGIAQHERTPRLAAWILATYPYERVFAGGYRVRFRAPPVEQ